MTEKTVLLALDSAELIRVITLARHLGPKVAALKLTDVLDWHGGRIIESLKQKSSTRVCVDFKFCDIPTTIGRRLEAYQHFGADMVTLGNSSERAMAISRDKFKGEIFVITELTSETSLEPTRQTDEVFKIAQRALTMGITGVQCAPRYLEMIKTHLPELKVLVPGIRCAPDSTDDHSLVMTPWDARRYNADYQVWGRPIVHADNPIAAFERYRDNLEGK